MTFHHRSHGSTGAAGRPTPTILMLVAAIALLIDPPRPVAFNAPAAQGIQPVIAAPLGRADSVKFAVVGDHGTGEPPEYQVADQMADSRAKFPFDLVLMLGDNIYGSQTPRDFVLKFAQPFKSLLDQGVTFYATVGNHDSQQQFVYPPFNMGGERYYTYVRQGVRFFVLDTNVLDARQLDWVKSALGGARENWRIAYFHHPLYSDAGRHGSNVDIRVMLEPLFVKYGVDVVFSGHDHVYERIKPQQGITYFVAGSGGKLARGDVKPSPFTAAYYDQDQAFLVAEIAGDEMVFQAISRTGIVVDSGTIAKRPKQ